MDWIEQLLGVSPDGGSGALEAVYYVVLAFGVGVFVRWRVMRRRRADAARRDDG